MLITKKNLRIILPVLIISLSLFFAKLPIDQKIPARFASRQASAGMTYSPPISQKSANILGVKAPTLTPLPKSLTPIPKSASIPTSTSQPTSVNTQPTSVPSQTPISTPSLSPTLMPSPSPSLAPIITSLVSVEVQASGTQNLKFTVEFKDGMNVCDVMQEAKDEGKINSITFDDSYLSSYKSRYVSEINGYKNNWTFTVNGTGPLGCSLILPKPNDSIVWKFG